MSSLKKQLINDYYFIPKLHPDFQEKIITVVTAAGIIWGEPIIIDDETNTDDSTNVIFEFNSSIAENYTKGKEICGNDGFFELKNAQLLSNSGKIINFKIINIFFDQVIAITIGEPNLPTS